VPSFPSESLLRNHTFRLSVVAHRYNLSYSRESQLLGGPGKKLATPHLNICAGHGITHLYHSYKKGGSRRINPALYKET
jgi:hypothetical protein